MSDKRGESHEVHDDTHVLWDHIGSSHTVATQVERACNPSSRIGVYCIFERLKGITESPDLRSMGCPLVLVQLDT